MNETKSSETKPKKMVRRSVAITLGIFCVLLIAGLGGAMAYFTMTINDKNNTNANNTETINQLDATIASLNANITDLTTENNQLQTWLNGNETLFIQTQTWLSGNITYYNSQITNLQNQLKPFQGPILGFSDLTIGDNRTIPDNPYLHIEGTVHNFGIGPTLASLYVKAYHSDGSVAIETSIIPNSTSPCLDIDGQSSTNVDLNYYYNGSALASWTITVEEIIVI